MKRITDIINPGNVSMARTVLMKTIQAQPITVGATKSYVIEKLSNMNTFYKHLTGLDELEYYQDRVIELQNALTDAQTKRRELSYVLNEVRGKSIEIQDRLHKVKRHEDPAFFLELMREETDFIKKERKIFESLAEQERHERDVFSAFTNAIRDSQEKQRNRLEYAKYIGFGLTLLGAMGSYLITTWRTEDLKSVVRATIKDDVRLAFVESARESAMMLQQMSQQQMESQSKVLQEFEEKLSGEIEVFRKQGSQQMHKPLLQQDVLSVLRDVESIETVEAVEVVNPVNVDKKQWSVIQWVGLVSAGMALFALGSISGAGSSI